MRKLGRVEPAIMGSGIPANPAFCSHFNPYVLNWSVKVVLATVQKSIVGLLHERTLRAHHRPRFAHFDTQGARIGSGSETRDIVTVYTGNTGIGAGVLRLNKARFLGPLTAEWVFRWLNTPNQQ